MDEPDYVHGSKDSTGVLMVNLGTPEAPTAPALRRYLAQFLGDPRVIESPRWLWWLVLHGIVLRTRPRKVAHAYAEIWEDGGSPLMVTSRRQCAALQQELERRMPGPVHVELGMSYGEPSIPSALKRLREKGARRIVLLPLYPQYSGSTTGSVFTATVDELRQYRRVPEFRFIEHYADDPAYIEALAASVRRYREQHGAGDLLLMSFHGVPKRYLMSGDPYHCLCHKTARLVAERLGLEDHEWKLTFQSRFGREPWLQPYTDETVEALGRDGLKRLDVICPGFAADCLETLEEIAMQNRDAFQDAGGGDFHYIPCLNDDPEHVAALAGLVERHTMGWPETDSSEPRPDEADRKASRERALALGAEK
ncbi:MAG: ferrochelatase [Halofilum sp. (in: g-proteobacteria)]|nr:ferrochelatase [Halofilum sp. (in: g-proteobacteria)]